MYAGAAGRTHGVCGDERNVIFMDEVYEPPKATIYRFDENDRILTDSGGLGTLTANYAANALNQLMGGTNTTIE